MAKDAQGLEHDANQLLAQEEQTGKYASRAEPSVTLKNDDDEEEDATGLTEEDPLEWAYSMTHVPKIEVLVMQEVKCTIEEANRQDDTQSGVLRTKKARENQVVGTG